MTGILRIRVFPESNYRSVYINGKTLRTVIDPKKPIVELKYPEFYDVKITSRCTGGCPWCYMDSKEEDGHVVDAVEKIKDYFGPMNMNQRPFQVAIGGGNPNEHPDFPEILRTFHELGITPNYTTNGYGLSDEVMEATKQFCGGVAVSCHPHLNEVWTKAASKLIGAGVRTALHHIISDDESVDRMLNIADKWSGVDYHVLLPMIQQGRATQSCEASTYLFDRLKELPWHRMKKVAFGAKFYEDLCRRKDQFPVSLYEPEVMSKFLDLKDMHLYGSSFEASAV